MATVERKSEEERIQELEEVSAHLSNEMKIVKKYVDMQMLEIKNLIEAKTGALFKAMKDHEQFVNEALRKMDKKVNDTMAAVTAYQLRDMREHQQQQQQLRRQQQQQLLDSSLSSLNFSSIHEDNNSNNNNSIAGSSSKSLNNSYSNNNNNNSTTNLTLLDRASATTPNSIISNNNNNNNNNVGLDNGILLQDTHAVLRTYRDTIASLFKYYCISLDGYSKRSRLTLDKAQFTKFIREFALCTTGCEDIMWTKTLRALGLITIPQTHPQQQQPQQATSITATAAAPSTTITTTTATTTTLPAMAAMVELDLGQFEQALVVIAKEMYKKQLPSFTQAQRLENLLLSNIIPHIQQVMTLTIEDSRDTVREIMEQPMVQAVFKRYHKQLKQTFVEYREKPSDKRGISIKGFLNCMKHFELLPHISKLDLKIIHQEFTQDNKENELNFKQFQQVLLKIAQKIFSSKVFGQSYPTPEARLTKLFIKMYLLKERSTATIQPKPTSLLMPPTTN